jgi:hypothetical protein
MASLIGLHAVDLRDGADLKELGRVTTAEVFPAAAESRSRQTRDAVPARCHASRTRPVGWHHTTSSRRDQS